MAIIIIMTHGFAIKIDNLGKEYKAVHSIE